MKTPFRKALATTVLESWMHGLCFSVLILLLTAGLKYFSPQLSDQGIDAGIRLAQMNIPSQTLLEEKAGVSGYVFVDIDPFGQGAKPYAELCKIVNAKDCDENSILSRTSLAATIQKIGAMRPRLIILDVQMIDNLPLNAAKEFEASIASSGNEILAVADYDLSEVKSVTGQKQMIPLKTNTFIEQLTSKPHFQLAPASPTTEIILRRYPACFINSAIGTDGKMLPTLPMLAAQKLDQKRLGDHCNNKINNYTPRVIYTIPSLIEPASVLATASPLYRRCFANALWDNSHVCSQNSAFEGKLVVIGASSAQRGDIHVTPLGAMAGAEVIINAARSFLLWPQSTEETIAEFLINNLRTILISSSVWIIFWCSFHFYRLKDEYNFNRIRSKITFLLIGILVSLAAFYIGYYENFDKSGIPRPNADVLIPILGQTIEFCYIILTWTIHALETKFTKPTAKQIVATWEVIERNIYKIKRKLWENTGK